MYYIIARIAQPLCYAVWNSMYVHSTRTVFRPCSSHGVDRNMATVLCDGIAEHVVLS